MATHPIQYYAPVFRALAERSEIDIHVLYEWEGSSQAATLDPEFGEAIQWDIPLLDGYPFEFVPNKAASPGTDHFRGLDNPELVDRIQALNPDAILMYGWNYLSHIRLLRAFSGTVPILFRGDSTLLSERAGWRRMARRLILRWVYSHVDVALYVGKHSREYFEAHGLTDSQLEWAPHAVDNARFADDPEALDEEAQQWRDRLSIPQGAPTVLFAGKLDSNKAADILLEAFTAAGIAGSHLVFVGSGPLEPTLRMRASVLPGRVHFLGFQNQSRMPAAYRLGDVLVLPSLSETWGLAVNEAMASGRAVIVSDQVGCAPDLVAEGETGHVVPAGNAEALATAFRRVLPQPDALRRMGDAASARIAAWSIHTQAERIEDAVRNVSGRGAGRRSAGVSLSDSLPAD